MDKSKSRYVAFMGLLGALALVFSFLEGLFPPIPLMPPGAKLGLSNIVTMFASDFLGLPSALIIALIKGGFAFLTRGVTAGLMSTSGGILSTAVVYLLIRKTSASYAILGISGALAHNAAQLAVAYFITGTSVLFYIPALIFFGVCSGILTGLLLRAVTPYLSRFGDKTSSKKNSG
jgi:heptaprenyl diphosphate synthase